MRGALRLEIACPSSQVKLPLDPGVVLLDIGFTETDPNHGARPPRFGRLPAVQAADR